MLAFMTVAWTVKTAAVNRFGDRSVVMPLVLKRSGKHVSIIYRSVIKPHSLVFKTQVLSKLNT